VNRLSLWRTLRSPPVVYTAAAVLVATAVVAVTALAGWSARVEFVVGVALVAAFTLLAVQQLGESLDTTAWPRRRPEDADGSATEFTEDRVIFLETRLVLSTKDARVFRTRVQPALVEILRHQLRRHHGIDAQQRPDLAKEAAGEPLWRLVTQERDEPVTHDDLVEAVSQIERLSTRD
jgi:hypothetical protein